jgi:hypothetical protein
MSIKILTLKQFHDKFEACEANVGEIRFCSGKQYDGTLAQGMVICHKYYGKYCWTSLDKLSKTNKLKFADVIEVAFRNQVMSQNLDVDMGSGTYNWIHQECKRLKLLIKKQKAVEKAGENLINRLKEELEKKTCAMEGCPGMCARDFDEYNPEGFDVCFCCKKTQELECPICYETRKVSDMVCGSNCSHRICWKCYGMADRGGNKIEKCPMCRADF